MDAPLPRPAPRTEERRLLERWLVHNDPAAREKLCEMLLPVTRRLARRYESTSDSFEDLLQVANIGLLKAIDRFDLGRTTSLAAYAERVIDGELRHHLRDASALLHVPRALYAKVRAVAGTAARLTSHLGRRPTSEEIAREMRMTSAEVMEALTAQNAFRPESLDAIGRSAATSHADQVGADDPFFELIEQRATLDRTWRSLPSREQQALRLRFAYDLSYAEIGARLGMSGTHASRLVNRALKRLQAVALWGEQP